MLLGVSKNESTPSLRISILLGLRSILEAGTGVLQLQEATQKYCVSHIN